MKRTVERFSGAAFVAPVLLLALWLSSPAAARAQWATSGSNTVTTNTGNVGVGNDNPLLKLTVGSASQQDGRIAIEGADGANSILFNTGGGNRARVTTKVNGLHLQAYSASWFRDDFFIRDDGNVGVGTTSPGYPLSVRRDSSAAQHVVQIVDSAAKTWGPEARDTIYFEGRFTGQTSNWAVANINYGYTSHYNAGGATLAFDVVNAGGGWGNVMTLKGTGNVGVGTSSPGERLELYDPSATVKFKIGTGGAAANSYLVMNAAAGRASVIQKQTGGADAGQVLLYASSDPFGRLFAVDGGNNFGDTAAEFMVKRNGNVGIGTASPNASYRLDVNGSANVTGSINATQNISAAGAITGGTISATYQDVAEWVPSSQKLSAGTVVVLDVAKTNHVVASASPYDTKVAGVVSAEPGVILGVPGEGKVKVATTGRVRVRVDASRGAVRVGDLLVTSEVEGVAMKSVPVDLGGVQIHRPGTIIGKALEPLEKGAGEILVLLSLQ